MTRMTIDSNTIRRLRDGLIQRGAADGGQATDMPEAYQKAVLDRFAPFAETMYLMMQIDGHVADAERDAIRGAMSILTDGALDHAMLDEIFDRSAGEVQQQGVEGRLQAVGARISVDRQDRETAFSLAAAVAIADNRVEEVELTLISAIAEWYGISAKRSREILQDL